MSYLAIDQLTQDPIFQGRVRACAVQEAERLRNRGASPSASLEGAELRQRLQQALAGLAATDGEVLVLRFLEDLSTREMAAVLGLSESAVKMRQLRALQRLRDLLGDELEDEV